MAGHAVVVPYPGRGHINPMMHLATKLASHGISVTFVLTESWHKIITEAEDDDFCHAQKLGLDIRPTIIPDCVVREKERWGNMTDFFLSLSNMEIHVSDLITNLKRSGAPPSCIVADTFLKWGVLLAKRHSLLSVALWPMSVTTFSIWYHSDMGKAKPNKYYGFALKKIKFGLFLFVVAVGLQGCIDYIPGVPSLKPADLPSSLLSQSPVTNEIAQCFANVREADLVVVNSFYALECKALEALMDKISMLQSVGPLNMPFTVTRASRCSQWLDSKPAGSVIYVSFGSFGQVARAQVREIAAGLMQSGYCFIWALRPDNEASDVSEMLPAGFLETCKERGLLAGWFKQMEVLSHPAVGGFFSHCGWNAVMENVSVGVPMLGFPLGMDQFLNCKLVVDEWKFGVRGRSREDEKRIVEAEEISRKVKLLMEGEESVRLRGVAESFRDLAKEEVTDGLSATNLKLLAERLKAVE